MSRRTLHVLVVEDNPHDARLIEVMLATARTVRFEVEVVHRLEMALAWLDRQTPDLILLDLSLPDSHGLESFERLYSRRADVPIVVLSGLQDESLALSAVQSGAQDYLVKSLDSDDAMVRAVLYAIERFRGSRALRQREEHLRLLTDQLPCLFWTTDLNLRLTSFSGEDLFGQALPEDGLEGRLLTEVLGVDETSQLFVKLHERAADGDSQTLDLQRSEQVYHVHIEPFRQRGGRTIGTVGVALDVTDQKLIDMELRVTRQIQRGLRPEHAPEVDGFEIAGASESAAEAGGDFFDYFPINDGSTGVVVADVAGHGLGPAMMMCHARAYVRALAVHYDDPATILGQVNRFLDNDTREERLVALFLAKLESSGRRFHYANAGHRGYLFRRGQPVELLQPTGIPLNVVSDYQIEATATLALEPGDVVLLYTDGIIECQSPDGEDFGQERMLSLVGDVLHCSARAIVDKLFSAVHAFAAAGCVEDDMTVVIVKRVETTFACLGSPDLP